ncbi:XRE family transcriptional regulator [Streptomyces sp. AS58]|uniref:XRE family transcriptional regulator n=1 Tax=Streptomyces cadmiisoli TaxID=2184053 RepID=A0A2Z4JF55_9ACTN|nr:MULTISPECIES: helix-turn-helix domain-containing protein [Streptomyces]AWW43528.1 XRE family transcriptional regulator [Streptomyces cadmiisoli]KOV51320.1 XRE family transcriptional regulator [Streptomyces sp. AS58]
MTSSARPDELGAFLKARRADLSPRSAGLPESGGRRRVPGLRREEVAALAVISTDYYTRLEQGRMQASAPVLNTLARVLHLDDDQRTYMFQLAGRPSGKPARRSAQKAQPRLQRLLDDLATTPGIILGRRMDILAWNPLATALVTDFSHIPEKRRNYIHLVFTDPKMRELYADWKNVAHTCVAQLRMEAARDPDNPRLTTLVGELSVQDADFRRWWADHHVAVRGVGTKTLRHPVVGELTLDWDTLASTTDTDQQLVVWSAEPGSPSHDALRILASWANATTAATTGTSADTGRSLPG